LQGHGADAQPGAAFGVDSDGNAVGGVSGGWSCEFAATALLLGGLSDLFSASSSAVTSRGVTVFRLPRPVSRKPCSRRGGGAPATHQQGDVPPGLGQPGSEGPSR
jgi:hypothetical protein